MESPLVCTNAAQRSAEDWGYPLRARGALTPEEGFLLLLFGKGRRCGQDTGVRLEAVWMIVQHERSELNLRFRPQ